MFCLMFCWKRFCRDFLNVTSVLKVHLLNWRTVLDGIQYLHTYQLGTKLHGLSEHTWKRNMSSASSRSVASSDDMGDSTAGWCSWQVMDTGRAWWCQTEEEEIFSMKKKSSYIWWPFCLNKNKINSVNISCNVWSFLMSLRFLTHRYYIM